MNDPQHSAETSSNNPPSHEESPAVFASATAGIPVSDKAALRILESIADAFFTLDTDWCFTYLNAQAERLLVRTRTELLGKRIWDEFPESVGSLFEREYRRAVAEETSVSFEQFYAPLDTWFEVRAYPSSEGLSVLFQDITERVKRSQREQFLADLAERARRLTDPDEVIADALRSVGQFLGVSRCVFVDIDIEADLCTGHPDYRADDTVVSMAGTFSISAFGNIVVAEYGAGRPVVVEDVHLDRAQVPEESISAYDAVGIRAHASVPVVHSDRLVSCIGVHSAVPRHWKPEEVALLQAVVERTWLTVEVTRQGRALVREAEERRETRDQMARTLESITEAFFTADREWRYTYINRQVEALWERTREELLGMTVWQAWPQAIGTTFEQQFRRAMNDGITVSFEEFFPPLNAWLEVRVYPSDDGISVFFQDVSLRKKAEDERERLLADLHSRAEREALLNRIGQSLRGSPDPEQVVATAVALLGNSLAADRCYFAFYDLAGGTVRITHDWHRADLPAIRGQYPFINTAEMFQELYRDSNTSVIVDAYVSHLSAQTVANMERLNLRSRVSVALADATGLTATLTAAMADEPRNWTAEEVSLIEAVATQLRLGVETARIQQREHRIAVELQEALQPELPGTVPGLSVTKYYEAALTGEAGVGGDFYDVFSLEKGRTALVVGDLSGKGLAAAAQVSIVRNMLRAFLYSKTTLTEAVTELNRILAENNLLNGFSTLFVGAYDSGTRALTYVNCGQEPALVRREATGYVELLQSTGPILGSFETARYTAQTARLAAGDALAIFTDGLTEVGPTRLAMLGVEGVTALFAQTLPAETAQNAAEWAEQLVLSLVAGVNAAAQGGVMRDDMCLLVGVVE